MLKVYGQLLALRPDDRIKHIVKVERGADNMWDVAYEQEKSMGALTLQGLIGEQILKVRILINGNA